MYKVVTVTGLTFEFTAEYQATSHAEELNRKAGELGVPYSVRVYDTKGDELRTIVRSVTPIVHPWG